MSRDPVELLQSIDPDGRPIDFGRTADDYDRYRPGFPTSFFARLFGRGEVAPGQHALDLGTGTGTIALGLASRGLRVTALDRAPELLAVGRRRATYDALEVRWLEGRAEELELPDASVDVVTAGQCWWWFDEARVLDEVKRVLVPGGRIVIAGFCYLPLPGSAAERSEALVLRHNPKWPAAGSRGIFPEQSWALSSRAWRKVETYSYDEEVELTHEAWRGRMRACNGVAASLSSEAVAAFDRELGEMLARDFPKEPLSITHRVFVATAIRPA